MARDDHDQMSEFEWMRARSGPGPRRGGAGEAGDEASRLLDQLERLRAENSELRASLAGVGGGSVPSATGQGRSARTPTLAEVERDHILKVLLDCHWRVKGPEAAADLLGLNPGTLYSRMKKLGIHRDDQK